MGRDGENLELVEVQETAEEAVARLGEFILKSIPGEPRGSENVVNCAIRIMEEAREKQAKGVLLIVSDVKEITAQQLADFAERTPKWAADMLELLRERGLLELRVEKLNHQGAERRNYRRKLAPDGAEA